MTFYIGVCAQFLVLPNDLMVPLSDALPQYLIGLEREAIPRTMTWQEPIMRQQHLVFTSFSGLHLNT
ncbi:MAG: hypothetical protein M3O33_08635 [Cyanobacteriota bacterium]|nr:hypothetical protein [Cyanobacteriota bacterium]